jgi:hypothetical protein
MPTNLLLQETKERFLREKALADGAMAQVSSQEFLATLDGEANSIGVIVKHLGGNLKSRWTEFLSSDGEKASRDRDAEFLAETAETRESLLETWEAGWRCLFDSLDSLSSDDLVKTVVIRGESHSAISAMLRSLTHTAEHVGQIVLLAKHFAGPRWRTLSVPRGQSREFTAAMLKKRG